MDCICTDSAREPSHQYSIIGNEPHATCAKQLTCCSVPANSGAYTCDGMIPTATQRERPEETIQAHGIDDTFATAI